RRRDHDCRGARRRSGGLRRRVRGHRGRSSGSPRLGRSSQGGYMSLRKLAETITLKQASGDHPPSLFLRSLARTPISWQTGVPWYKNLLGHLQTVYAHGQHEAQKLYNDDTMRRNLDLGYRYQRLSDDLEGRNPTIKNPLDRFL